MSVRTTLGVFALVCVAAVVSCVPIDKERKAEKAAVATAEFPLAGFWKPDDCSPAFGLAIDPAGDDFYSISFCGPGGCFEPGTYRPNSKIHDDPAYEVLDTDNINVKTDGRVTHYVRCADRVPSN